MTPEPSVGEAAPFDYGAALASWPRLYLDTSDLIAIADEVADAEVVHTLIAEIAIRRVLVIFTPEHLIDLSRSSGPAGELLGRVAERFPWRCIVEKEPSEIEPHEMEAADITLRFVPNAFDFFTHPAAAPYVEQLTGYQDEVWQADVAARHVAAGKPPPTVVRRDNAFFHQCMVSLARGWLGSDIDDVIRHWEGHEQFQDQHGVGDRVRARLQLFSAWWEPLRDLVPEEERIPLLRRMAAFGDPRRCPGGYLGGRLSEARVRDGRRNPLRSDMLDTLHAAYLPYVDIATCDTFTRTALAPALATIGGPRSPRLLPTGNLRQVVAALQDLPMPSSELE